MIQAALLALTATAFLLTTSPAPRARLRGALVGIAAQGTWVVSVNWSSQWGIGAVTVIYLGRYVHLAWTGWRRQTSAGQQKNFRQPVDFFE